MDRELRKSGDATHLATDGPAPRRYDGHTTAGGPGAQPLLQLTLHTPYVQYGYGLPASFMVQNKNLVIKRHISDLASQRVLETHPSPRRARTCHPS